MRCRYASIAGGSENVATAYAATIGGGVGNVVNSSKATIGGGFYNSALAPHATIAGGSWNTVRGEGGVAIGSYAVVKHANSIAFGFAGLSGCNTTGAGSINLCASGGVFVNGESLVAQSGTESANSTVNVTELEERVTNNEEAVADLVANDTAFAARLNDTAVNLGLRLDELDETLRANDTAIKTTLTTEIHNLDLRVESAEATSDTLSRNLSNLATQVANETVLLTTKLEKTTNDVAVLTNAVRTVDQTVNASLDALSGNMSDLSQTVGELQTLTVRNEVNVTEQQQRIEDLEQLVARLMGNVTDISSELQQLQSMSAFEHTTMDAVQPISTATMPDNQALTTSFVAAATSSSFLAGAALSTSVGSSGWSTSAATARATTVSTEPLLMSTTTTQPSAMSTGSLSLQTPELCDALDIVSLMQQALELDSVNDTVDDFNCGVSCVGALHSIYLCLHTVTFKLHTCTPFAQQSTLARPTTGPHGRRAMVRLTPKAGPTLGRH